MAQMKLSTEQKQSQRHKEQTCGCQGGRGGSGMHWESGVSRWKLVHLEWIKNKVLLYSTGNYIQPPEIDNDEKEYKEEYIYVCMYNWVTAIQQKLAQNSKTTVLQLKKIKIASFYRGSVVSEPD